MMNRTTLTPRAIALNLSLSLLGMSPLMIGTGLLTMPNSAYAQYGLGLPRSAGTGGATRGKLPQITMIVPEDGAKTLAARPSFYWYIAPSELTTASSSFATSGPKPEQGATDFKITFFLRDGNERSSRSVFMAEGVASKPGLYKFTLPADAPELMTGKVQRWQIRWQANNGASQVDINSPILREDNPKITKEIALAKNSLEAARIYAKNAYWYDAINAYTLWLSENPKDMVAVNERNQLLNDGFKNHTSFSKDKEDNITKLISQLNLDKSFNIMQLQPRSRR
ncbi:MAG: DUF928 domain-containing protein [Pseudanabaenaceae cyanobacterium bins.39]|nr:DUF928 domain-containing protein [Pseudanabaenaceae cyanobacterium bins.39]